MFYVLIQNYHILRYELSFTLLWLTLKKTLKNTKTNFEKIDKMNNIFDRKVKQPKYMVEKMCRLSSTQIVSKLRIYSTIIISPR